MWLCLWCLSIYSTYLQYLLTQVLITWGFSFHKAALKYQYSPTTIPQQSAHTVACHYNTVPITQYTRQGLSQYPYLLTYRYCISQMFRPVQLGVAIALPGSVQVQGTRNKATATTIGMLKGYFGLTQTIVGTAKDLAL